jgi:hypothetical protein
MPSEIFEKYPSPFHTPETFPSPITHIDSSSDKEMLTEKFFYSNTCADNWVPGDYLKTVMNTFKEKSTELPTPELLTNNVGACSRSPPWPNQPQPKSTAYKTTHSQPPPWPNQPAQYLTQMLQRP